MFKNGFRFEVVKNGIIGEITGVTREGVYGVLFFNKDGIPYYRADVFEGTIRDNLRLGNYKEV